MKKDLISLAVVFLILVPYIVGCKKETAPAPTGTPVTNLPRSQSLPGARVFLIEPANGQTVSSPITVKFGIEGIELAPAGEVKENSGHHHLLIDRNEFPPLDQPLPFNNQILHFGQGQTEAVVNLPPGSHTLQLILAAGNHIPHEPPVLSEKIRIGVP